MACPPSDAHAAPFGKPLPHVPQHDVRRGNDRQPCFFQPIDRLRYPADLRGISRRAGCAVHAYVLMTGHVHLLVTPTAPAQVGHVMQVLGRRYVRYGNDRYRRTGTLREGRYKSCPPWKATSTCCAATATSN